MKKDIITDIIKKSSIFLLIEVTSILLITTLLFFIGVTVTKWHLPIITLVSVLITLVFYKKDNMKINIIAIILGITILSLITFIEGKIYDSTADGNTYHKLAIGSMKNGWNPNYEDSKDFKKENGNVFDPSEDNINTLWIDHYAKGTEIYAAVIYAFTSNIETGKGYTVLLMYIGFGILFSYLYKDKKRSLFTSLVISILLVFNTITVVQLFNYYVDGALLISILLIIFCLIVESDTEKCKTKENLLILGCSVNLCINIKFTGIAFAGIFCFVFYIYWLIKSWKIGKEEFKKQFKKYTLFYIVTVIISICIVGYSSYTRNIIDHGHPLYPLYGEGHVANMVVMEQPSSFNDKNHLEIFLISIFSKGENVSPTYSTENIQPTLKIPFTILDGELENYSIPDIRMSGFGPLFSGVFIITIIGCIYVIIKLKREKKWNLLIPYLLILGISTILILSLDGNYWARYIPYFYSIPILVLSYLLWDKKRKIDFLAGIVLTLIILTNVLLIFNITLKSTISTDRYIGKRVNEFMNYCNEHNEEKIEIKLNHMGLQGVLYNLDDLKIENYYINQESDLKNEAFMFNY